MFMFKVCESFVVELWYYHDKSFFTTNSKIMKIALEDSISNVKTCDGDDMIAMLSDIFGIPTEVKIMNLEENKTTQEIFDGQTLNIPHPDIESFNKLM